MDTKQLLENFKQALKNCIHYLIDIFPNHKNELRNFLKYCKHKKTKEIVELYHNDTQFLEEIQEDNKYHYFYIQDNSCWIFNIDFIEMITSYEHLTNEQIDTIYHHLFQLKTFSTLLINENKLINTTIQLEDEDLNKTNEKFTELLGNQDPTIQNLIGDITNNIRSNNGQFDFNKLLEQTTKSIEDKVNNGELTEEQLRQSAEAMLSKMPIPNIFKNMFL
jgi:hypothetical protein